MTSLRKIHIDDLAVGMFFAGFEGPWIVTPFWRTKFLIRTAAEIQQARASNFEFCWIDISLGRDIASCTASEGLREAPIEALVVDDEERDLQDALKLYECAKQSTHQLFRQARLGKTLDVERCQDLVDEVAGSLSRNPQALLSLIRLKQADDYTYLHSFAVCTLMVALGRTLGMDDVSCKEAGLAGYLHDVGKAFLPVEVLNKPGTLTDLEYKSIQRHTTLGYEYLSGFAGVPEYALNVVLHHHEKVDGTGYPGRQQGVQIDLYSRMAAVCDVYDAITSARAYKSAWDPAESVAKMASWKGHFDRPIFLAFVKALGIYPVGSIVKLRSGRTALVVRQNPKDLTRPVVKAFKPTSATDNAESETIDLAQPGQDDPIVERGGQEWIQSSGLVLDSLRGGVVPSSGKPSR